MSDRKTIYLDDAIDDIKAIYEYHDVVTEERIIDHLKRLPSAEPTHREKALLLLLDWAVECGFGYDNIPEEYAIYEKDVESMGYMEGLIYIAEREVEHNERPNQQTIID